jgi:hypothetical protein
MRANEIINFLKGIEVERRIKHVQLSKPANYQYE